MNILVTGAGGFIGRHLCAQLATQHTVFGVVRGQHALPKGVVRVVADLCDNDWTKVLPAGIDAVVALAQSRRYREFPEHATDVLRVNVASLVELLDWSRQTGIEHFVYASSGNVYAPSRRPIDEETLATPTSFYGQTKRMAEMALESYADFFPATVLRLFTVYGPAQSNGSLIPLLFDRIAHEQPVTLAGADGLMLTPIYVGDVCLAMKKLLAAPCQREPFSIFNLGGPEVAGIRHIAEEIGSLVGRQPRFEQQTNSDLAEGAGWISDTTRFERSFGLRPNTSLREGLQATWDHLCKVGHGGNERTENASVQTSISLKPRSSCSSKTKDSFAPLTQGSKPAKEAPLLKPAEEGKTSGRHPASTRFSGKPLSADAGSSLLHEFTWAAYATYLEAALSLGYVFVGFDSVRDRRWPLHERFVLLRHDIDYDPRHIAPISRIEAERGVRAAYFFQPSSPFYDFEDPATQQAVAQILRDGHELALHFDATKLADDEQVVEQIEQTATQWERRYGTTIAAVSFHMPSHRPVRHLVLQQGRINTYAPDFFRRFDYLSDSNQNWRGRDPMRVFLEERPSAVQWLTHPIWWRETHRSMLDCLSELAQRLGISVERDILTPEQRTLLKQRREVA